MINITNIPISIDNLKSGQHTQTEDEMLGNYLFQPNRSRFVFQCGDIVTNLFTKIKTFWRFARLFSAVLLFRFTAAIHCFFLCLFNSICRCNRSQTQCDWMFSISFCFYFDLFFSAFHYFSHHFSSVNALNCWQ